MALLAQGFDPSGYTPSYAVANAANEQMFQNQQQGIGTLVKGINDAQKQQKDLVQKDKEMAAKIKGTMSLLDNAKGIYTEFAPQIDAMKVQLADPSISNLDKAALSDQVTNSLNMFAQVGTEGVKTKLIEAQIKQAEAQAEAAGKERTTGTIIQDGKPITVYGTTDIRTNKFIPDTVQEQNATSNVSDLTSWVAGLEGFNPKAYSDSGQTSIGYGTRAMKGESEITPEEAKSRLESELGYSANRIDSAITQYGANLNPNQRKALVSFDFNTGKGAELIRRYANDPAGLRSKMLEYNKLDSGDKSPSKGLMNRRTSEVNLFDTPYTTQQTEAISGASQMQTGQPATSYVEVPPKPTTPKTESELENEQLDIALKELSVKKTESEVASASSAKTAAQQAQNSTIEAGKVTLEQIDKFLKNPILLEATTGFGAETARGFKKTFISDKVELGKKQLTKLAMMDILRMAKDVKPLSNDERTFLEKGVPALSDPPLIWKDYLENTKRILSAGLAKEESQSNEDNAATQNANRVKNALLNLPSQQNK